MRKVTKTALARTHLFRAPSRASACVLSLGLVGIHVVTAENKVIDVCQLFHDLPRFDGQTVSLRGAYNKEVHGAALTGEKCLGLEKYVVPGSEPSLWLVVPGEAADVGARSPRYQIDRQGFRELERLARTDLPDSINAKVTAVGQLTVFKGFELKRMPDGGYAGNGFGPYGMYPAVLVIQTLKDVVLSPGEKHDGKR